MYPCAGFLAYCTTAFVVVTASGMTRDRVALQKARMAKASRLPWSLVSSSLRPFSYQIQVNISCFPLALSQSDCVTAEPTPVLPR